MEGGREGGRGGEWREEGGRGGHTGGENVDAQGEGEPVLHRFIVVVVAAHPLLGAPVLSENEEEEGE